jgi:hypothetical protein
MSSTSLTVPCSSWALYLVSILPIIAAFLFLQVVSFCFLGLYLSATGPRPWSIDALRRQEGRAHHAVGQRHPIRHQALRLYPLHL